MKKKLIDQLQSIHKLLDSEKISHKLIGGFALAALGAPRTTIDIDFLVNGKQKDQLRKLMLQNNFVVFYESDEILQFSGTCAIDFLLANRPVSEAMLNAKSTYSFGNVSAICPEDFVGLKIQAYKNNPKRELQDKADIQKVIEIVKNLDWNKIRSYAETFNEWNEIEKIKINAGN